MAAEIRPTSFDDLLALSRFLTDGFHTPAEAPFAAPDVLRWKYFDPRGGGNAPRSYIAVEDDQIVGHLGLCTGSFRGAALGPDELSTLHMIDWLSARRGSSIGASLMLRSHRGFATQYGLGGSEAGRSVGGGGGYRLVTTVPVFRRVLRLGSPVGPQRAGRWAKNVVHTLQNRRRRPAVNVTLRTVDEFGAEVEPILDHYQTRAIFTNRRPELLNHFLRYPRGGISGWLIENGSELCGFGLLSIVDQKGERIGKLVDCVVNSNKAEFWHAAVDALTQTLKDQGAKLAEGFASTPWMAAALRASGYREAYRLEFRLRDKQDRIPAGAVLHLTPLEADYAYT